MQLIKFAATAAVVATLVACGGGGSAAPSSTTVLPAAAVLPVNASTGPALAQSLVGVPLAFPGGVPGLAPGVPTTLTLTSASTFSAVINGVTVTGQLAYGSCKFTITSAPSGLPPGAAPLNTEIVINPCEIRTNSQLVADGSPKTVPVTVNFQGTTTTTQVTMAVSPTGTVTLYTQSNAVVPQTITTTSVQQITGITGAF